MKIAVLSLTRDRSEYTEHCFESLRLFAGCEFDHFVLDQGSISPPDQAIVRLPFNVGISRGMNLLLDIIEGRGYDVVVKFDNDCELSDENTLVDVARLVLEGDVILSPRILGLRNPPPVSGRFFIGDEAILDIPQIGGIFLAAPAHVYDEFRFDPDNPTWGMDDVEICAWWRARGGRCGYVERLAATHYETTDGQQERYPAYFDRKFAEMR